MCMTKQTEDKSVKRDYKSRMFTMIFSDKKELLLTQGEEVSLELLVDV